MYQKHLICLALLGLMLPGVSLGQTDNASSDPFGAGGDAYGPDPFGASNKTRVVLMMKGVDKQVARQWFNAYVLKQGSGGYGGGMGGMGGGSYLQNADFEVDLERESPEVIDTRVVVSAPPNFSKIDLARRFEAAKRTASKFGLEAIQKIDDTESAESPRCVVQSVISMHQQANTNFKFWETVAKELAHSPPTIELFYRAPVIMPADPMSRYGGDAYGPLAAASRPVTVSDTKDATESEQVDWQKQVDDVQDRIGELVNTTSRAKKLTTEQITAFRKELGELLAARELAMKQIRQGRGRAIIEQATQLIEEAEAAYKKAIEPASIDAELDRLLR